MSPLVLLLTGFPGTGKLTVAHAIVEALDADAEHAVLVDNHSINNVVFRLVEQDGMTPLPDAVWDRVGEVAMTVFTTLESLTPRDWHVVSTAYLDGRTDTGYVPRLESVAATRSATFVPVVLLCDPDENVRRIESPERRRLMKSIDPEEPRRLAAQGPPYDPGHPNGLTLDITDMPPAEAARRILDHARTC